MSLFCNDDLAEISVYYCESKKRGASKITVVPDYVAEDPEISEEQKNVIKKVTTKWKVLSWEDHNSIVRNCTKRVKVDDDASDESKQGGNNKGLGSIIADKMEQNKVKIPRYATLIDEVKYREEVAKTCLVEWDIVENEKPVPVNDTTIRNLNNVIMTALFFKYDDFLDFAPEDLGN